MKFIRAVKNIRKYRQKTIKNSGWISAFSLSCWFILKWGHEYFYYYSLEKINKES